MKKIFSFLIFTFITGNIVFGQLTERLNDSTVYRFGTRPKKGTMALSVGFNFNDTIFSNFKLGNQGIFIMGRYFITDRTAIRGSIKMSKYSHASRGYELDTTQTFSTSQIVHDLKRTKRFYAIMPGIERHFKYHNMFDIYFGGDAIFGLSRAQKITNDEYTSNIYSRESMTTPETDLGLNGVIGMNFFVGDLPLSIGFEYNASMIWKLGGKTHVVRETRDSNGNVNKDDYYTEDADADGNPDPYFYKTLRRRFAEGNQSFRVSLNFYIK